MRNSKTLADILERGKRIGLAGVLAVGSLYSSQPFAEECTVAEDLDSKVVLSGVGTRGEYENAVQVDYEAVVAATPEYASIKRRKLEGGDAKYWLLRESAIKRATSWVKEATKEYDLVVKISAVNPETFPDCHGKMHDATQEIIDAGERRNKEAKEDK